MWRHARLCVWWQAIYHLKVGGKVQTYNLCCISIDWFYMSARVAWETELLGTSQITWPECNKIFKQIILHNHVSISDDHINGSNQLTFKYLNCVVSRYIVALHITRQTLLENCDHNVSATNVTEVIHWNHSIHAAECVTFEEPTQRHQFLYQKHCSWLRNEYMYLYLIS